MINPILRPDLWGGLATHAGDALFECCYQPELPAAARALRAYGGSWERFWDDFRSRARTQQTLANADDPVLVNTTAMAACYSADEDGTVRFPFDLDDRAGSSRRSGSAGSPGIPSGGRPRRPKSLRSMRAIWIDSGTRDEYFLDLGATAFRNVLRELGVPDDVVHFELFEGRHGGIVWRYPLSLRFLAERLSP